jgi:hypothetical protein
LAPRVRDAAMRMLQALERRRRGFVELESLRSAYYLTEAPEAERLLAERLMRGSADDARSFLAERRADGFWYLFRYESERDNRAHDRLFKRLAAEWPEFSRISIAIRRG